MKIGEKKSSAGVVGLCLARSEMPRNIFKNIFVVQEWLFFRQNDDQDKEKFFKKHSKKEIKATEKI